MELGMAVGIPFLELGSMAVGSKQVRKVVGSMVVDSILVLDSRLACMVVGSKDRGRSSSL